MEKYSWRFMSVIVGIGLIGGFAIMQLVKFLYSSLVGI